MVQFRKLGRVAAAIAGATLALSSAASAQDKGPIRIAYIDPLSGPFANVGDAGLKHFRYIAEQINKAGGVNGRPFEIVPMDNKSSPQESTTLVQRAIDQGIPFVTQGNGSNVAGAIIESVNRNNRRNRDNQVLFLNYAAVDPSFTNDRCSYWHFRFDANSEIKLEALTNYMKDVQEVKKVYLINQDYSHGHHVASGFKRLIAEKRPDIEIVGEILHPIGQVRDFSPYIARIRQSGADSVVTGNWGNDMTLLVREATSAGLNAKFYTYYGGGLGVGAALGKRGVDSLLQITEWHANLSVEEDWPEDRELLEGFKKRHSDIDWYYHRVGVMMHMLKEAIEQAGSTEGAKVAEALSGLKYESVTGTAWMRPDDHQLIQPMYISIMKEQENDKVKYDIENSGVGFTTLARIEPENATDQTSCKMDRP
jgi:branched-chain amino acid transport system substrate-binding protein